ncbi:hypothetical protein C9374_004217 [Naegleria lovaniensis]|uniref:Uncharacterized protein n=1 Tax=Naegleria lovaniensis TaxID=51637 RepID=A0AA88GQM7_NAELO|nr:uncharacterized protein C9374_004217 [Naegleria lovaniensis]KAG2383546.1 hypothetical protein C9374_004217 [Naegleria lovaniensis]
MNRFQIPITSEYNLNVGIQSLSTISSNNDTTNGTNPNAMNVPEWFGWIGVVICILAWGTFGLPLKVKWVQQANIHPFIFQFYFSSVVCITSFIVLAWNDWYFSFWGMLGSACWVPCSLLSLVAISKLGLGVAQGIWSGTTILTSFVWSVTLFQSRIGNFYLTALGLLLMVVGIVGVATCSKWNTRSGTTVIDDKSKDPQNINTEQSSPQHRDDIESTTIMEQHETRDLTLKLEEESRHSTDEMHNSVSPPTYASEDRHNGEDAIAFHETHQKAEVSKLKNEVDDLESSPKKTSKFVNLLSQSKDYIIGVVCAVGVGVLGGTMFVPTRLETHQGVAYVIGFGVGAMAITSVLVLVFLIYYFARYRVIVPFHFKVAIFPAVTACLWQLANIFAFYVALSPLGMTIGIPLTQTSLVVAGLCGLLFFKELLGWKAIAQFFVSALIFLIPGCILLALFGKA